MAHRPAAVDQAAVDASQPAYRLSRCADRQIHQGCGRGNGALIAADQPADTGRGRTGRNPAFHRHGTDQTLVDACQQANPGRRRAGRDGEVYEREVGDGGGSADLCKQAHIAVT